MANNRDSKVTLLQKFYTEKTVCIIGGAPIPDELFCDENEIDTYVQVNDHCKINGKPVDVLYHAATEDLGLPWHQTKVCCYHVCGCTAKCIEEACTDRQIPHIPYRKELYKGRNSPFGDQFNWLCHFMKDWDVDPFSGIIALIDVLRFNPKKVYLTGMDFYSNGRNLPERRNGHYIEPQVRFLKELKKTDSRVVFDPILEEALTLPIKHMVPEEEYQILKNRLSQKANCQPT